MELSENIQVKKQMACEHKTTVVEDRMILCASCGEEIHRIISTGKEYSERFIYRLKYDRTERFIRLLDECAVNVKGVRVEIIRDFERLLRLSVQLSATHGKSKRLMNLNFVLYQLCKKNGIDVDKSKFKL